MQSITRRSRRRGAPPPRREKYRDDRRKYHAERPEIGLGEQYEDGTGEDKEEAAEAPAQSLHARADRRKVGGGHDDRGDLQEFGGLYRKSAYGEPSPPSAVLEADLRDEDRRGERARGNGEARREAPPVGIRYPARDEQRDEPRADAEYR